MTVPDAIYEALVQEGRELEQAPGEVIKDGLNMAFKAPDGWHLKLRTAAGKAPDPRQIELPLGRGQQPGAD